MKNIAQLWCVLLVFFCLSSCEDTLDRLTQFTISDSSEVVIPEIPIVLSTPLLTPDIEINLSEQFENNNSRKDLIESAKLTKMTLIIKSPDGANFDFLNKVELFIEVEGEDSVLLASVTDIPEDGLRSIPMVVTDIELKQYLNKDTQTISGTIVVDKSTDAEITVEIASEFFIDAKILGI